MYLCSEGTLCTATNENDALGFNHYAIMFCTNTATGRCGCYPAKAVHAVWTVCAVQVMHYCNRERLQQPEAGNVCVRLPALSHMVSTSFCLVPAPAGEFLLLIHFPFSQVTKCYHISFNLSQSQREPRRRLTLHKSKWFWLIYFCYAGSEMNPMKMLQFGQR